MSAARDGEYEPVAKPHRLVAKIDRWGEPRFDLECPYTLADRRVRRCNLGHEATEPNTVTGCAFKDYENGEHHHSCPAAKDREAQCSAPEGSETACWPSEPDECDGFESYEVGHLHPSEGCWAREMIGEIGWEDAVSWRKDQGPPVDVALPALVDVWSDDEGVQIALWTGSEAALTASPDRERSR